MIEIAVLLHNVRSSHNVGSIFRTADAAGVKKIYLTGYTPRPIDFFDRPNKEIAKTALGAELSVKWEYAKTPNTLISKCKKNGWHVVGVEQDIRAKKYQVFTLRKPALFIFGNEVKGLSKSMRDACDSLIEIPMRGKKESLNVSVAAGIILFHAISN